MDISELIGKVIMSIDKGDDYIEFATSKGERYKMYHSQDCCESVYIEDINGDLKDLIGVPILKAEETTSDTHPEGKVMEYADDSFTYTFYHLATIKGYVTIRWYGSSNGYYSESVYFEKVEAPPMNITPAPSRLS